MNPASIVPSTTRGSFTPAAMRDHLASRDGSTSPYSTGTKSVSPKNAVHCLTPGPRRRSRPGKVSSTHPGSWPPWSPTCLSHLWATSSIPAISLKICRQIAVSRCRAQSAGATIVPGRVGSLPEACAALNRLAVNVQLLAVEGILAGRRDLLHQAAYVDPLLSARLGLDQIRNLVDELLDAHDPVRQKPVAGTA